MSTVRETFGLCCPKCRQDDRLMVQITNTAKLHGDGTEAVGDDEWSIDSPCGCTDCNYWSTVTEFTVTEGGQP